MSSNKVFILLNPASGRSNGEQLRQLLSDTLEPAGVLYAIHEIDETTNFAEVIAKAIEDGYTLVVAAGGDGTICAIASALNGCQIPLAILPVGTANLLARDLNIPFDLAAACQLLLTPEKTVQVDIMRVGDKTFVSHISLGTYTGVANEAQAEDKRRYGRLLYVWQTLHKLRQKHTWPFAITVDGQTQHVRASLIMCANIGAVGLGDLQWGEDISSSDGVVNICVIKAQTIREYLLIFGHMVRRQLKMAPQTLFLHARSHIDIKTPYALPIRGDGELIGHSSIHIEVVPRALTVVAPS